MNRINQATLVHYLETNRLHLAPAFERKHIYISEKDKERYDMYTPLLELVETTRKDVDSLEHAALASHMDVRDKIREVWYPNAAEFDKLSGPKCRFFI